jgi:predicted metal-dependent enzyme (double-stranded beta helix superfamily)
MTSTSEKWIAALARKLDQAVQAVNDAERCQRVKEVVSAHVGRGACPLDSSLLIPASGQYGRRLLYKDPAGVYSVVLMIWGTEQSTPLHDHSGMWCVECVCEGSITVNNYKRLPSHCGDPNLCDFELVETIRAGVGDAGALIPPFDYHTIHNHGPTTSATIHVYGGEITECNVFMQQEDGYQLEVRQLTYTD